MQKNIKKQLFSFALFIIVVTVVWYAITLNRGKNTNKPVYDEKISVIAPQAQKQTVVHSYIGRVDAINATEIVPYISGYVVDIIATGGQKVQRGDVLLKIQQDEYIADLAAAEANLFSAKADYLNAKIKYERMQSAGEKAVSLTELDNAKAQYLSAKGNMAKAEAQKFSARTNLEYTLIKAPFDGVLGNIASSIGNYISPQSRNLAYLVQYDPIRVVFSLSDKEFLNNMQHKNKAPLTVKAQLANGSILPQTGKIQYSANQINPTTNSIAVYAIFANPEHLLIPDAFVNVLLEREYENVVKLQKNWLIIHADGDYVYSVKEGVLTLHKVDILAEQNNYFLVKNSFAPNEMIVVEDVDERMLGKKAEYKLMQTEK